VGLAVVEFVLDTNAALYFLGDRLKDPLPEGNYVISVITELELLAYPDITREEEAEIRAFLNDVQIEGLTKPIKTNAIDLRRRFRLRLPDAIIAATALSRDAVLLTNDKKILSLEEIPTHVLDIDYE
jgi:predicted nucleic acid-binding protein